MSKQKAENTFWDAMHESAGPARSSPGWMTAGINLNEKNFTTYRGDSRLESPGCASSPGGTGRK
jgi:hypothetical protein